MSRCFVRKEVMLIFCSKKLIFLIIYECQSKMSTGSDFEFCKDGIENIKLIVDFHVA